MAIDTNLQNIRDRMAKAASRVQRSVDEIQLIAVTKTVAADRINKALRAGITHLGENKVQEAKQKISEVYGSATWHLIGHLQTNKVAAAIELFSMIQSVDSERLLKEINKRCSSIRKRIPVLLEINIGEESSKTGLAEHELESIFALANELEWVEIKGFMVIPPYFSDPEKSRPFFKHICEIRDQLLRKKIPLHMLAQLSMGMSNDFEVAIEEQATMIRVGTAIFGERS